jgi:hypothetical protein
MDELLKEELNRLCDQLEKFAALNRRKGSETAYIQGCNAGSASAYEQARVWLIRIMEEHENG